MSYGQSSVQKSAIRLAQFVDNHPVAIHVFPPTIDHTITAEGQTRAMKRAIAYIAGQGYVLLTASVPNFDVIRGHIDLPSINAITRRKRPTYGYARTSVRALRPAEREWEESMIPQITQILERVARTDRNNIEAVLAAESLVVPSWLSAVPPFDSPKSAEPVAGEKMGMWQNLDHETQQTADIFYAFDEHNSTPDRDRVTVRLYYRTGSYATYTMAQSQYRALKPQALPDNTPYKLMRKVVFDRTAKKVKRVIETHIVRAE